MTSPAPLSQSACHTKGVNDAMILEHSLVARPTGINHPAARPVGRTRRLILTLLTALLLAGSLTTAFGQSVDAAAPIKAKYGIKIYENNYDVNTGIDVANGERLHITCRDTIWAGSWLFGRNGPDGISGWYAGNDYPLPNAQIYSLLGKLNNSYFFNGSSHEHTHYAATSRLYLRINDNVPGNGNGYFTCDVEVFAA